MIEPELPDNDDPVASKIEPDWSAYPLPVAIKIEELLSTSPKSRVVRCILPLLFKLICASKGEDEMGVKRVTFPTLLDSPEEICIEPDFTSPFPVEKFKFPVTEETSVDNVIFPDELVDVELPDNKDIEPAFLPYPAEIITLEPADFLEDPPMIFISPAVFDAFPVCNVIDPDFPFKPLPVLKSSFPELFDDDVDIFMLPLLFPNPESKFSSPPLPSEVELLPPDTKYKLPPPKEPLPAFKRILDPIALPFPLTTEIFPPDPVVLFPVPITKEPLDEEALPVISVMLPLEPISLTFDEISI